MNTIISKGILFGICIFISSTIAIWLVFKIMRNRLKQHNQKYLDQCTPHATQHDIARDVFKHSALSTHTKPDNKPNLYHPKTRTTAPFSTVIYQILILTDPEKAESISNTICQKIQRTSIQSKTLVMIVMNVLYLSPIKAWLKQNAFPIQIIRKIHL